MTVGAGRQPAERVAILTPDRKLRVFVSSTLQELAEERSSVRQAISALRLTPVMFEVGARPHPPRTLYRSYLEQSDVFLGIYWERYGWIAPELNVSGLEDEYELAGAMPKLIYVKEPAAGREPRLATMLERVRERGDASYKPFQSPEELAALVAEDLAMILTEHFHLGSLGQAQPASSAKGNLPVPPAPLIGRHRELAALRRMLQQRDVRLVTVTGPGGVGKTRLALEAARVVGQDFAEGVWLVPLAGICDEPSLVAAVLDSCGARDEGVPAGRNALIEYLSGRESLLVLDNFEQALATAGVLAEMVAVSPRLKAMVTSRAPLRIRAEHELPLAPLSPPPEAASPDEVRRSPAVQMFAERSEAAGNAGLSDLEAPTVGAICRRLDGLPLAIELAAARSRLLSPADLLRRLATSLEVLEGGPRDLPDRQRTVQRTIDWTLDLLGDDERDVFARLGVFRGGFTAEAAEAVGDSGSRARTLDVLAVLTDFSLLRRVGPGGRRFAMLELIRESALQRLFASGQGDGVRLLHARYFGEMVATADEALEGAEQRQWLEVLDQEFPNIKAALEWWLESGEHHELARMAWSLWSYGWFFGHLGEVAALTRTALERHVDTADHDLALLKATTGMAAAQVGRADEAQQVMGEAIEAFRGAGDLERVAEMLVLLAVASAFWDPGAAQALVAEASPMFVRLGSDWGTAICANVRQWVMDPLLPDGSPAPGYREAVDLAIRSGDDMNLGMAYSNLAVQELALRRTEAAAELLGRALKLLGGLRVHYALAYCYEQAAEIALRLEDPEVAAQLLGAGAASRERLKVPVHPAHARPLECLIEATRQSLPAQVFAEDWLRGERLGLEAVVGLAAGVCDKAQRRGRGGVRDELG